MTLLEFYLWAQVLGVGDLVLPVGAAAGPCAAATNGPGDGVREWLTVPGWLRERASGSADFSWVLSKTGRLMNKEKCFLQAETEVGSDQTETILRTFQCGKARQVPSQRLRDSMAEVWIVSRISSLPHLLRWRKYLIQKMLDDCQRKPFRKTLWDTLGSLL